MRLSKYLPTTARYWGLCVLFLLITGSFPLVVYGQTEPPQPQVIAHYAWEGYLPTPCWTEVQITLTNDGGDWEGDLLVFDSDNNVTHRQRVSLPSRSNKFYRVPFYVTRNALVSLENSREQLYRQAVVPGRYQNSNDRVCVVSDANAQLQLSTRDNCGIVIVLDTLQTLPEAAQAWDLIDVLLINGSDTSTLTVAQQEALLAWVGMGGHLVLGGGGTLPQVLQGLPTPLRIAAPGATLLLDAPDNSGQRWQALTLINPQPQTEPLHTHNGALLATRQRVGIGTVDVIGWDLAISHNRRWMTNLWALDVKPATAFQNNEPLSNAAKQLTEIATTLPLSALPKVWLLLLFVPLYILLIGPISLLIVRRLRKPIAAWILLPAWIGLGVLSVTLMLNSAFTRALPASHEVALLIIPGADLPARGVQTTAIYTPGVNRRSWQTAGDVRNIEKEPYYYGSGELTTPALRITHHTTANKRIEGTRIQGVGGWITEGLANAPITITLDTEPTQGGRITGRLRSPYPVQTLSLIYGGSGYKVLLLEDAPADTLTEFSAPLNTLKSGNNNIYTLCPALSTSGYSYYAYGPGSGRIQMQGCYLVGTLEGYTPFPNLNLTHNRTAETCFFYTVPCPRQNETTAITLTSIAAQTDSNTWIDEDGFFYLMYPYTTLTFTIPEIVDIKTLAEMTIEMEPSPWESTSGTVKVDVLNWITNEWQEIPQSLTFNKPLQLRLSYAEGYINNNGQFSLRLSPEANTNFQAKLTILLEE